MQYYGYHKHGDGVTRYDDKWMDLPFFVSSQETSFEMSLLKKMDYELLIAHIAYKQRADIYNLTYGYDNTSKQCSSLQSDKEKCHKTPAHGYVMYCNKRL